MIMTKANQNQPNDVVKKTNKQIMSLPKIIH